ncbi:hypothetical protein [uncultured Pseudacidovorax sp.]|uniref:hypothetical protein n=1 Tax=uncultured Pseudacidovorax sp. TaxID=679313 RepID=UPI0025D0037D|nr:hypothetical protein [uncultured Pseudacidovorax sp.]
MVKPGQVVTVKSNQTVSWSGSSPSGKVTAVGTSSSDQQWQARLANANLGATEDYPLVATASSGQTTTVRLKVRAGDSRNGKFMAFVSNGSRQQLKADFDLGSVEFVDAAGLSSNGTIVAPAAGSKAYGILSTRELTAPRVSGFQILGDMWVGSFPFPVPGASPVTYAPYPFVASRALITAAADLDGTYNRFRVNYSGGTKSSVVGQIQLAGSGSRFVGCNELSATRVDDCPTASLTAANLVADPVTPGMWLVTDAAKTVQGRVAVTRIGTEKVLLIAGPSGIDPSNSQFSVGLQEQSTWVGFNNSFGWSSLGSSDQSTADLSTYVLRSASSAGTGELSVSFSTLPAPSPQGLSLGYTPGGNYFLGRSQQLEVMIGSSGSANTTGFFHIGVISN